MTMKKRLLSLALALVLVFSLGSTALAAVEQGQSGDIIILTTNDVHNGISDGAGYAGLAAYKAEMEAIVGADNVTLVDAGDSIQGAAIGVLSKGGYLIDIMDYVGYDIAIPGNHEFDFGMARFLELADRSTFDYVACNFIDLEADEPVFDAYKIVDYGTAKIAYIGICTPETFTKSTPAYFQDAEGNYIYGFCEDETGEALYAQVQAAIDAAIEEGVDYIIAIAHLGIDDASKPWTSGEVIANTAGIDVIVDGHSHSTIDGKELTDKDGNQVLHVQTGTKLANIGKIVISADGSISAGLVEASEITEQDEDTAAFIKSITDQYEADLKEVVASSDYLLTVNYPDTGAGTIRAVRSDETNLGDLCADAYRTVFGADVAIVNGGGVRANIKAGDITLGDILAVHPFANQACLIEVTGQVLLDALENGARALPGELGGFLQVSGITYTIDTSIPSSVVVDDKMVFVSVDGPRRVKDVMVGGQPLDPEETYTVASIGYILKDGGDGYSMFKDCKVLMDDVMLDSQVLITYITEELGGVVGEEYSNLRGQGRITITPPYSDVSLTDSYYEDIMAAVDAGLMEGSAGNKFEPEAALTRAAVVSALFNASGEDAGAVSAFKDVAADAWYAGAIAWAAESGIVQGFDGFFRPDDAVSRQEFATLLFRYYDYIGEDIEFAELTYTDADEIASWAAEGVAFCEQSGLLTGEDGVYNPAGTLTRAEGASVLSKIVVLELSAAA